jgi:hypothetical protein
VGATALVVTILLLAVCLVLGYLAVRLLRLVRGGGVDVSLRRRSVVPDDGSGWRAGVGRYRGDELAWYRLVGLRPGPTVVIDRTELEIVDRRQPTLPETDALPQAASVLRTRCRGADVELAMAPGVLTGFLAWLEATPPGRTGYRQAS